MPTLQPTGRLAARLGRPLPGYALLMACVTALAVAGPAVAADPPAHLDNPFLGARGYVNPEWKARADEAIGGSKISNSPTSVWIDRVALAIGGTGAPGSEPPGPDVAAGERGLRAHLDAAVAQGAGYIQIVLNNLPGKDCDRWYPNNEFQFDEVERYQREFIDPIVAIEANPKYRSLRIINIVEPRWVQNLVLNTGTRAAATPECDHVAKAGSFVAGVRYALTKLHQAGGNIYTYLDAGAYYEVGWAEDSKLALQLIVDTVKGTADAFASVDGFTTNIGGYAPITEPFFTIETKINGTSVKQSKWVDWNNDVDELPHALRVRTALIGAGFSSRIGMVIDTSRNGWGGPSRPTKPSTSNAVDMFVDGSRVDQRIHTGNWCNQIGAGLGERPVAAPRSGIDAYSWIKTPGESDGSSVRGAGGGDPMCDPTYQGSPRGSNHRNGAMPNAPARGAWFPAAFEGLLKNAYPALP